MRRVDESLLGLLMLSSTNFSLGMIGMCFLAAGVILQRREIGAASGLNKLVALHCVFIAAPLAMFAVEHFRAAWFIQQMVPSWMPWPLFWAYFVGIALLAAATSLTVKRLMLLSSALLGLMFFIFVCTIHLPLALEHAGDRFVWTVALRDLCFAAGTWSLLSLHSRDSWPRSSRALAWFSRGVFAAAAVFFAVQHLLHPHSAPGVPLEKMMPAWVPLPSMWTYLAGAILLVAGVSLLVNRYVRIAAASVGAVMTFFTVCLYVPILVAASAGSSPEITEGLNYVADTLLFAGCALALAAASRDLVNLGGSTAAVTQIALTNSRGVKNYV